jgi:tetratricopeptide (TPR) repeat protein
VKRISVCLVIVVITVVVFSSANAVEYKENLSGMLKSGLELLRVRKDGAAGDIFSRILENNPADVEALWGKAEILRRKRDFEKTQEFLNRIFAIEPKHAPSLIILSYIKYKSDKLDEAQALAEEVLSIPSANRESRALAYMLLGSINARRSSAGGVINKIKYGIQIEHDFLKAKVLAPDLAEIHMALGSFYLLAPSIAGGNLNKAFRELNTAIQLAPDFATANARLAQAYEKKGDLISYNFYLKRAKEIDPGNEVLQELGENRQ